MRTRLLCVASLLITVCASRAQGIVDFRNGGVTFGTVADRNVYDFDGVTPLKGSNWGAQLWYGGATASESQLVATGPTAAFRSTTSTGVGGVWVTLTPQRVLDGIGIGETANLQVRVWDTSKFATWDAAVAGGGLWQKSAIFAYTVPAAGSPPDAYYLENLRAFRIVPEPSTIALGTIGLGSLLLFRRRK